MNWVRIGRKDPLTKGLPASNQTATVTPATGKLMIFILKARDSATFLNKCLGDGEDQDFRLGAVTQTLIPSVIHAVQCPEETLKEIFSLPSMR